MIGSLCDIYFFDFDCHVVKMRPIQFVIDYENAWGNLKIVLFIVITIVVVVKMRYDLNSQVSLFYFCVSLYQIMTGSWIYFNNKILFDVKWDHLCLYLDQIKIKSNEWTMSVHSCVVRLWFDIAQSFYCWLIGYLFNHFIFYGRHSNNNKLNNCNKKSIYIDNFYYLIFCYTVYVQASLQKMRWVNEFEKKHNSRENHPNYL
jgi:hypothetical protein